MRKFLGVATTVVMAMWLAIGIGMVIYGFGGMLGAWGK